MNPSCLIVLLLSVLSITPSALAWNESGHLQIAALAYGELSTAERKAVDQLLAHHEKYAIWKREHDDYRQRTPDDREVSLGFYVFTRASVFPDEIRDYNDPTTHATWHFVTFPLTPPRYSFKKPLVADSNVVVAKQRPDWGTWL